MEALPTSGRSRPREVTYGAAKAALESYRITSNVVFPPVTDTGWVYDAVRRFVESDSDHIHVAEPSDVAEDNRMAPLRGPRMITGNVIRMR